MVYLRVARDPIVGFPQKSSLLDLLKLGFRKFNGTMYIGCNNKANRPLTIENTDWTYRQKSGNILPLV